ncbi:hypothetical protein [Luteibacter aegosomatis]|nr:hypothetical protein [Luteibacter aegosomatis]
MLHDYLSAWNILTSFLRRQEPSALRTGERYRRIGFFRRLMQ